VLRTTLDQTFGAINRQSETCARVAGVRKSRGKIVLEGW